MKMGRTIIWFVAFATLAAVGYAQKGRFRESLVLACALCLAYIVLTALPIWHPHAGWLDWHYHSFFRNSWLWQVHEH